MSDWVLCLLLLCCIIGCRGVQWSLDDSPKVDGTKGQYAILPCSFTHPEQQSFTGEILVKWITGTFHGPTMFQCSVMNSTEGRYEKCSDPNVPNRYSLRGNPRERNLSLLIQGLELSDIDQYYCRVELDNTRSTMYQSPKGTFLNIPAPPEILSLSQVPGPPPSNVSLECVAEGNPRPTLTYHSPAGLEIPGSMLVPLVPSKVNRFRTMVHIPMATSDPHICRATNKLDTVEQSFLSHQRPSALVLALCVSGAMLLLGLGLFLWLKHRGTVSSCNCGYRHKQKWEAHSQPPEVPVSEIPLYANSIEAKGDTGIIYADISVKNITNDLSSMTKDGENDVCYAEVKFN
ncbi:sialic acid binding Ig-like lectin 15, like isoform X2 [Conger conger]|uniref:sialic acid binding Ig-like lectin 15, like isoform X2 n=1 Tax=Conger conger TaxID=82655 RepID=UPI002A59C5B5|nr:sialic acid binding Ig-like lectin 15, like isoform X2 [Conger conger]